MGTKADLISLIDALALEDEKKTPIMVLINSLIPDPVAIPAGNANATTTSSGGGRRSRRRKSKRRKSKRR